MLAFVAKKKLKASGRSLGFPAARAPFSYSVRMVVIIVSTCGFPAPIRLAISAVLSWVPVERKCRDTSFSFAAGPVESDDAVRAVELVPECLAAGFFSSRRRAYRSMMMFVIMALAGLFQLPPRLSVYCANAGAHVTSN